MTAPRRPGCDGCSSRRDFLDQVSGSLLACALATFVTEIQPLAAAPAERTYEIPAKDGVSIDKSAQVILVRAGQKIIAFNLACPHENTALKWRDKDNRFQCPKHESKYTPEGVFTDGRATRNMDRLAIRREGNQVVVALDRLFRSDQNTAAWAAAVVQL